MTNIIVGNLSFRTTQEEIHQIFANYGAVERVNLVTDRDSGQSRGFAFVEMTNGNEAEAAINAYWERLKSRPAFLAAKAAQKGDLAQALS